MPRMSLTTPASGLRTFGFFHATGGRSWAEGDAGQEAIFYFTLPGQGKNEHSATETYVAARRRSIRSELVITGLAENNLANHVVTVRDGEEALDYLRYRGTFVCRAGADPVVVLLDLKLTGMNGLQVLKQIKADEKITCPCSDFYLIQGR